MSSYHALPFLIMNYGAQMLFILQQRLLAQNVTAEKGSRVLSDVVRSLFAPEFIAELMRPQPLYTPQGVREVFDKLAQSSIMRLKPSSMNSLFSLMTMGVKHILVTSRFPTDLIESTLNQMDTLMTTINVGSDSNSAAVQYLAAAIKAFGIFSSGLSMGELADVRCTLLTFVQDRNAMCVTFVHQKFQNSDGTFNVPYGGRQSHHITSFVPGKFIYYEGTGNVVAEAPYPNVHLSPWQASAALPGGAATFDPFNPSHRTTTIGQNIYLSHQEANVGGSSSSSSRPPPPPPSSSAQSSPASYSSHTTNVVPAQNVITIG